MGQFGSICAVCIVSRTDVYLMVLIYPFCLMCISALDAKLGQQQWWDTWGRGWRGALWEKTARRSGHVGEVHRGCWRFIAVERIGNVSWSFPTGVLVEQIYSEYLQSRRAITQPSFTNVCRVLYFCAEGSCARNSNIVPPINALRPAQRVTPTGRHDGAMFQAARNSRLPQGHGKATGQDMAMVRPVYSLLHGDPSTSCGFQGVVEMCAGCCCRVCWIVRQQHD